MDRQRTVTEPENHRWRVGRKVGRTIYVQTGPEPTDRDPLIGVMDTPELAVEAVRTHNIVLAVSKSFLRRRTFT